MADIWGDGFLQRKGGGSSRGSDPHPLAALGPSNGGQEVTYVQATDKS